MAQRRISLRTGAAGIGLATAAALGLGALTAGSASAQDASAAHTRNAAAAASVPGHFVASGVNIRTGPSTGNTIIGQGQNGEPISVHCWQRNGSWWNITDVPTGVTGWVYWPDNVLVDFGVGNPPYC